MARSASRMRLFRPRRARSSAIRLEALEGRDLPDFIGFPRLPIVALGATATIRPDGEPSFALAGLEHRFAGPLTVDAGTDQVRFGYSHDGSRPRDEASSSEGGSGTAGPSDGPSISPEARTESSSPTESPWR